MWRRVLMGLLVSAAFASAVPAAESFFPLRKIKWLADDEIAGSGFENPDTKVQSRAASRDDSGLYAVIRRWRDIAMRARRDARHMEEPKRTRLIELAEWCEARANRLEASIS
jgi:hypothetical protein